VLSRGENSYVETFTDARNASINSSPLFDTGNTELEIYDVLTEKSFYWTWGPNQNADALIEYMHDELMGEDRNVNADGGWLLCTSQGKPIESWHYCRDFPELQKKPRILMLPRVKGVARQLSEAHVKYTKDLNLLRLLSRILIGWCFFSFFAVVITIVFTILFDNVFFCIEVWNVNSVATSFFHSISMFIVVIAFLLGSSIFFGMIWEGFLIFTATHFALPTVLVFFPKYSAKFAIYGNKIRYAICFIIFICVVIVSISQESHGTTTIANEEAGTSMFLSGFGVVTLMSGKIMGYGYVIFRLIGDIYSIYIGIRHGLYLDHNMAWTRYRRAQFSWIKLFLFVDPKYIYDAQDNIDLAKRLLTDKGSLFVICMVFISPWVILASFSAAKVQGEATFCAFIIPISVYLLYIIRGWRRNIIVEMSKDIRRKKEKEEVATNIQRFRIALTVLIVFIAALFLVYFMVLWSTHKNEGYVMWSDDAPKYPLCTLSWSNSANVNNSIKLSPVDLTHIVEVAYKKTAEDLVSNLTSYWGPSGFCDATNLSSNCSDTQWQLRNKTFHPNPVYYHMYHPQSRIHIIAVRGTKEFKDAIEDVKLWGQVMALQAVGTFFPLFNFWTTNLINDFVYDISWWQRAINKGHYRITDYYEAPLRYATDNNIPKEKEFVIVAGHSLGGGVAQIVAAHLYENSNTKEKDIMSFGLSSPGTLWSAKKFAFKPETLASTSVTIYGKRDPIFTGDKHDGLIESFHCNRGVALDCHKTFQSLCEITNSCYAPLKRPPDNTPANKKEFIKECQRKGVASSKCGWTWDQCTSRAK